VDSAEARRRTSLDRLSYTELKADAAGVVLAKGPEPGEVVRAGQMVVQLARGGRKDAVFDVPAQMFALRGVPTNPTVEIILADDKNIKTTGRLREVATQPDPATRTFAVRIALDNPPEEMRLGATVTGGITLRSAPIMEVPSTALTKSENKPAVWVVDPAKRTVALRNVVVAEYRPSTVIIASGLRDGEMVVTAGVHVLRPGQKVKPLRGAS
jgi:RND family efflux transporter MFP subunit